MENIKFLIESQWVVYVNKGELMQVEKRNREEVEKQTKNTKSFKLKTYPKFLYM